MRLTTKMKDLILEDKDMQLDLARIAKVSQRTITDRCDSDSELMTTVPIYEYLVEKTGWTKDQILTEESISA